MAVAYAREHGIKQAARHFAWAPRTIRAWVQRWEQGGLAGLVPKIPAPRKRRLPNHVSELIHAAHLARWSAARTRAWLEAAHDVRVSTRTIQRVFRDIRTNRRKAARERRATLADPVESAHAADRG